MWRWPLIHRLTGRPRIDGLWHASLEPTPESHIPPEGNRGPIEAYLAISQTYWRFSARLITKESHSTTRSHFWIQENSQDLEWVSFIYDNSPRQRYQHRSSRHLGTCTLRPGSRIPEKMSATYFTDRYTQGDIQLQLIGRDGTVAAFNEAEEKRAELETARDRSRARKAKLRAWLPPKWRQQSGRSPETVSRSN
ncbi:hypothetical protein [Pseudonocardia kongjuensis]